MIDVIGGYAIEVQDRGYAIGKKRISTNKKTGEKTITLANVGYYMHFKDCLKAIRDRLRHDAIDSFDGDLETAIKALNAADERFNKRLAKIMKEENNA